ncbi:MAG TPA: GxxExxY protein [Candidatus Saccharimonadales bacterium]|nr:GxxExxY protein [Candidatus Saccharimonadales bacterium]
MNTDETQMVSGTKDFSLQPVTQQLSGAAFEVHNVLGFGFLEKVYQRAMQVELELRGVQVELEPKLQVQFKGAIVGDYAADLLIANRIIVELKTDAKYQPAHEAQLLNELRGTGIKLGYPINFGRERVEYKRMVF